MSNPPTIQTLAQPTALCQPPLQLGLFDPPGTLIHHKVYPPNKYSILSWNTYGVSPRRAPPPAYRVLTKGLLLARFDQVRDCLKSVLGHTAAQREAVLRLLRLYTYYGRVYPKAATIASAPGCSRATFWRVVASLERRGLLERRNQYVLREKAQTSNLYLLTKLCVVIARYLAEHGQEFYDRRLRPLLAMPGSLFWPWVLGGAGPGPGGLALDGL